MSTTIYHNPDCGTSRNTLAIIRASGTEPAIIEYLKTPPTRDELRGLVQRIGVSLREVLRHKDTPYHALGLDDPAVSDEAMLDAIEAHPILINRPIVVTPKGVRLCRPSEQVLDLLEHPLPADYIKEDGERVAARSPDGRRRKPRQQADGACRQGGCGCPHIAKARTK